MNSNDGLGVPPGSGTDTHPTRASAEGHWFATTSWTAVAMAGRSDSPQALEAMGRLCKAYWKPLYAYLRRLGKSDQDAKDLTQEFFLRLVSKNYLGAADRRKGKFRNFFLTAFKYFVANEWEREHARKRGGGREFVSLDADTDEDTFHLEPPSGLSPAGAFERQWTMAVFQQARSRLRQEYVAAGKAALFDRLKEFIDDLPDAGSYNNVAADLQMTRHAVTVAVYRLRQRFAEHLRLEVACTLVNPTPAEIERELRHLVGTLSQ
jgi:RNA polymerase sigma-70 factor (ECF subfamily)